MHLQSQKYLQNSQPPRKIQTSSLFLDFAMRLLNQSSKLNRVSYDIRGPLLQAANKLEANGADIIKLNIGNPAPFDFVAPDFTLKAITQALGDASGYCDSKGLKSARETILEYYTNKGVKNINADDVFIGNGVSELIIMVLQGLVDADDEVLIPAPDYPLWTAATNLAGARAVHYLCEEAHDWQPNLNDIAQKITSKTRAIVVINPNNPTGALYSDESLRGILALANAHNLVVLSDEIYDRILYDGHTHTPMATLDDAPLVLTFNGLSKSHCLAGFRVGWLLISGNKTHAQGFLSGLETLSNMRLCSNVPAQHAIIPALNNDIMAQLTQDGGRLHTQRNLVVSRLNAIPGVSTTTPKGAFYLFARLDPKVYPIEDDEAFMMEFLHDKQVLMVQGTGFNWPHSDHFRVVFLPNVEVLDNALDRLEAFLAQKRKA